MPRNEEVRKWIELERGGVHAPPIPSAFSSLITSAPMSASSIPVIGPATTVVMSSTFMPLNGAAAATPPAALGATRARAAALPAAQAAPSGAGGCGLRWRSRAWMRQPAAAIGCRSAQRWCSWSCARYAWPRPGGGAAGRRRGRARDRLWNYEIFVVRVIWI